MGIEKISSVVYQTGRNHFLAQKAKLIIGADNKAVYLDYAKHNYNAPNIYSPV